MPAVRAETPPRRFLDAGERRAPIVRHESDPLDETGGRRQLACAACARPVTDGEARIAVGGEHEHEAANPHGYRFRFGCFARAAGCVSRGVPSKQHTWFPGYHWQVQECGGCREHLGWLFFQPEHEFYGLILERLVEIDAGSPD